MKKTLYIGLFAFAIVVTSCNTEKNDDGTTDSITVDSSQNNTQMDNSGTVDSSSTDGKADTLAMSADTTRKQQ